jgi:hypothetical protein
MQDFSLGLLGNSKIPEPILFWKAIHLAEVAIAQCLAIIQINPPTHHMTDYNEFSGLYPGRESRGGGGFRLRPRPKAVDRKTYWASTIPIIDYEVPL